MKIGIGSIILESNSFSPLRADLNYFRKNGYLLFGDEVFPYHLKAKNEVSGFIDYCRNRDVNLAPTLFAWAVPYGPLLYDAYLDYKNELLKRIKEIGKMDAFYMALHGSMIVDGLDDPEGDILESVRKIVGRIPLSVSYDYHANITEKMVIYPDFIIGYNSFPHTNLYEVGEKSAQILLDNMVEKAKICRIFIKIPLVVPLEKTTIVPGEKMFNLVRDLEAVGSDMGAISFSIFGVQPWLDVDELGASIVGVVREEKLSEAVKVLERFGVRYWELRQYFLDLKLYSPEKAVEEGSVSIGSPVLLNEPADNVGSGATGDSTFILRELLRKKINGGAIITIVDPETVEKAINTGIGNTSDFFVGGKINKKYDRPIDLIATVRTIFDGRYTYQGSVMKGVETSMGRTVVLEIVGGIFVQVTELPVYTIDPEHYRCVGLFPERMKIVCIKSQGSFKASYTGISNHIFYVDTDGISSSNILKVPYKPEIKSRIYPFNGNMEFIPQAKVYKSEA